MRHGELLGVARVYVVLAVPRGDLVRVRGLHLRSGVRGVRPGDVLRLGGVGGVLGRPLRDVRLVLGGDVVRAVPGGFLLRRGGRVGVHAVPRGVLRHGPGVGGLYGVPPGADDGLGGVIVGGGLRVAPSPGGRGHARARAWRGRCE